MEYYVIVERVERTGVEMADKVLVAVAGVVKRVFRMWCKRVVAAVINRFATAVMFLVVVMRNCTMKENDEPGNSNRQCVYF